MLLLLFKVLNVIMSTYSIKDIERLTGIKAHTIRIWESRYKILNPSRLDSNIRYYTDEQLKLLMNISLLNQHGFKISKLAAMSPEEISRTVTHLTAQNKDLTSYMDQLIMATVELDETSFDKILNHCILVNGIEETVKILIYPFLEHLGILWQTGTITPVHEHFISNLIRQKIIVAIDSLPVVKTPSSKSFILFLPEGEYHEIGLLVYHFLLKKRGHSVFYLGQSTPLQDIVNLSDKINANCLLTSFVNAYFDFNLNEYLKKLSLSFPDYTIYITGRSVNHSDGVLPSNINIIEKITDLDKIHNF